MPFDSRYPKQRPNTFNTKIIIITDRWLDGEPGIRAGCGATMEVKMGEH
jgi:hypothetical protein